MIISKNLKLCALAAFIITCGMQAAESVANITFEKRGDTTIYAINNKEPSPPVGSIFYAVPQCWINSLHVYKDFQKKGIGSQLFKRAINEMPDCENIRLVSYLSSMDFYVKQGAQIDTKSQCYADRILWLGANAEGVCFKDATEKEKANYVNHLYKLNKANPTETFPHVSILFENKKQK